MANQPEIECAVTVNMIQWRFAHQGLVVETYPADAPKITLFGSKKMPRRQCIFIVVQKQGGGRGRVGWSFMDTLQKNLSAFLLTFKTQIVPKRFWSSFLQFSWCLKLECPKNLIFVASRSGLDKVCSKLILTCHFMLGPDERGFAGNGC